MSAPSARAWGGVACSSTLPTRGYLRPYTSVSGQPVQPLAYCSRGVARKVSMHYRSSMSQSFASNAHSKDGTRDHAARDPKRPATQRAAHSRNQNAPTTARYGRPQNWGTGDENSQRRPMAAARKSSQVVESSNDPPIALWRIHKEAVAKKLQGRRWDPKKKLSPEAIEGVRALHTSHPSHFTTAVLAEYFQVSSEAIRRILKSKWQPSAKEDQERIERWNRRGERIWSDLVAKGMHAPKKWREAGIGKGPRRGGSRARLSAREDSQLATITTATTVTTTPPLLRSPRSRFKNATATTLASRPETRTEASAQGDAWVRSLADRL